MEGPTSKENNFHWFYCAEMLEQVVEIETQREIGRILNVPIGF